MRRNDMKKKILFAAIAVVVGVVAADDMELDEAMEIGDMKAAVALAKKTLAKKPNDYYANLAMAFHKRRKTTPSRSSA